SQGFESYYTGLFQERWPDLRQALLRAEPHYTEIKYKECRPYYLDTASVKAALMLDIAEGDDILDLCSAPGGKSLVLAGRMEGGGILVANEYSPSRRQRLKKVLSESLPESKFGLITITGRNARKSCRWRETADGKFDKILLDVPCSSEQHVLKSPAYLQKWSPSRITRLKKQQYAFLLTAMFALRPGGTLLYCTCALSPNENEAVMQKFLKKNEDFFEIETNPGTGEQRKHGWQILPDKTKGMGPIYFCKLGRKNQELKR
ncbi:MAG: RsmB/NOP family class I SAM-dependent RNA methyltransferase, partial [Fibrobacteria bacterium]|nr:RsmB/NOP family class I SAM-dependent RNA methyltransferase [Fibrobacteria bacterium]